MSTTSRAMGVAAIALLILAASVTTTATSTEVTSPVPSGPVFESSSSGLITFSIEDRVIRVAVAFVQRDVAAVPTVVRFIDAQGTVLKTQRAELRDGQPVIAELTRQDIGEQLDVLVRAEVTQKFPERRSTAYPVVITLQPIAREGFGRFGLTWFGGSCPTGSGFPGGPYASVSCPPTAPAFFTSAAR